MQFEVEMIRRFYVKDTVTIEADTPEEAFDRAYADPNKFVTKLPDEVYLHMSFEDMEIEVQEWD